jgi:hypothetical protein
VRVTLIWAARLLLEENIGSCGRLPSSQPAPAPQKKAGPTGALSTVNTFKEHVQESSLPAEMGRKSSKDSWKA